MVNLFYLMAKAERILA